MQKESFPPKPKFHIGTAVPVDFLIGRHSELAQSKKSLIEGKGNVLLVGKRKIGKTSFVKKLKAEAEQEKTLAIEINLLPYNQDPSSFLREVLLLLCYEIGERVFSKTTSSLLASLGSKPPSLDSEFGRFYRVYKLTRFLSISQTTKASVDASVAAPLVGKVGAGKNKEERIDIGFLQPFEFIRLTQELMDICHKAGYESAVVFADEANRLATQISKDILQSYLEVFGSKQIQFVFVADISLVDYEPIKDVFNTTVKLGSFDDVSDVRELLLRYYRIQLGIDYSTVFSAEPVEQIWNLSKGHPFLVQLLCSGAIDEAYRHGRARVEVQHVTQAWVNALNRERDLIQFWE